MKAAYPFAALLALLFVAASCGKELVPVEPAPAEQEAIVLSAALPDGWSPLETKAEITSDADLRTAGFGVFAYYTGSSNYTDIAGAQGVIFNNRRVTYSSGWSYGSVNEYWPTQLGEKVSFFAYAPWGDWNGSVSATGAAPTIPYSVIDEPTAAKIAAQKDLLWGTQSSGSPYRDVTRDATGGIVDFQFRHAISKMRFYIAGGAIPETVENETYTGWSNWSGSGANRRHTRTYTYTVQSGKYYVNTCEISGLSLSGTLSLNNTDAYVPSWSGLTGNHSNMISASNVLNTSLQYINSSSPGIVEELTSIIGNESSYIYVIPGATPTFSVNYTIKYVQNRYSLTQTEYQDGRIVNGAPTLQSSSVTDGATTTVSATMPGPVLPSRKYDINLHLQGSKVELVVVPQRWDVQEVTYDYSSDENEVLQALTYDADYIDYARGGDVYINNRLGHFYFRLGPGMYKYWQASMISADGAETFGFCDNDGNFLYDERGNHQAIIRGPIDGSMSHIYMRALDSSSETGGRAKLRIYLFDSDDVPTVAMHLVNMAGVTEWTIVQNAN